MRLILQGKMTTLKDGERQPLNFIFFSGASLNIKRNNLKECSGRKVQKVKVDSEIKDMGMG